MFNSFRIVALLFAVVAVYYTVYDGEQYVNLERRAAVSLGKREVSSVGGIQTPVAGSINFATSTLEIKWTMDPAIISKLPYLNIDLYNAARPTRFFVFSVSSGMSRLATSFSWKIPNIAKIPTADSYVIRVWAPYSDRSRGDYWQLPDSQLFTISHFPIGVAGPLNALLSGSVARVAFFALAEVVNGNIPMTMSLVDPTSDNVALRNGIIIQRDVNVYWPSISWFVPSTLPESEKYAWQLGAVVNGVDQNGLSQVVVDQSSSFPVQTVDRDSRLIFSVSAAAVNYGDQLTFSWKWSSSSAVPFTSWNVILYGESFGSQFYFNPASILTGVAATETGRTWTVSNVAGGYMLPSGVYKFYFYGLAANASPVLSQVATVVIGGSTLKTGLVVTQPAATTVWQAGATGERIVWSITNSTLRAQATSSSVALYYRDTNDSPVFVTHIMFGQFPPSIAFNVPSTLPERQYFVRVTAIFGTSGVDAPWGMVGESASFSVKSNSVFVVPPAKGGPNSLGDDESSAMKMGSSSMALLLACTFLFLFF